MPPTISDGLCMTPHLKSQETDKISDIRYPRPVCVRVRVCLNVKPTVPSGCQKKNCYFLTERPLHSNPPTPIYMPAACRGNTCMMHMHYEHYFLCNCSRLN